MQTDALQLKRFRLRNHQQLLQLFLLILHLAIIILALPLQLLLEELYLSKKEGLQVLGFPCNDFGGQEPGGEAKIKEFCELRFAVTFPMFEKVAIKGPNRSQLYQWLCDSRKNGWNDRVPNWNFCKYLVDEKGDLILYANSFVKPNEAEIFCSGGL